MSISVFLSVCLSVCLSAGRELTELYSMNVCERSVFYWRSLFYHKNAIIVPMITLKFGSFTDIKSVFFV